MSRKVVIAAGAAVLLILLGAAYATADVVERGHLLPWAGADVRKVQVFGSLDFYISSETGKPSADLLNSYILLVTAAMCLTGALLLKRAGVRRLLVVGAVGLAYLSLDEQFAIHESIGHNLRFLADLPGVERPDDVVLALYAVPSLLFLVYFRHVLRHYPHVTALFASALVLFGAGAAWDAGGLPGEELLELAPTLALFTAFVVLLVGAKRREEAT